MPERTIDDAARPAEPAVIEEGGRVDRTLLTHLVRPLLPAVPGLSPAAGAQVERTVVDFVAAQIAVMPLYLRLPYRLALLAFNWLAVLRYGRVYVALERSRQEHYLRLWADSPIGVMRDFVKLIRSCALLQYLDHPLVLDQLERGKCNHDG